MRITSICFLLFYLFTFLPFYLYMHSMHEVVPSAVSAAVMMLASTWRASLHTSLFFIVYLLSFLISR